MRSKRRILLLACIAALSSVACANFIRAEATENPDIALVSDYEQGLLDGRQDGLAYGEEDGYKKGYEDGKALASKDPGIAEVIPTTDKETYNEGYLEAYYHQYYLSFLESYDRGYEEGKAFTESGIVSYSLHTSDQSEYIHGNNYGKLPTGIEGLRENSKPAGIEIETPASSAYDPASVEDYVLTISESPSLSDAETFHSASGLFSLKNLKIGTHYYYSIEAKVGSESYSHGIKRIYTEHEFPRLLDIDGVTNFRDVGGLPIAGTSECTVQGLVYRCGRLEDESGRNLISASGIEEVKRLGIKSEFDLRKFSIDGKLPEASAVDTVNRFSMPLDYSQGFFDYEENLLGIKDVFEAFADKSNYPIMFHCSIGTDRTGFVSFLLNSLLGVEKEYLYRDYMFSNFANIGASREPSVITGYINLLRERFDGTTLKKGAFNYLLSIGLSEEQIRRIVSYLSGEVNPLID